MRESDPSFKDFILDQLQGLGGVACRAMFGGHGFYCDQVFFGILFKSRLFFKTDPSSRSFYVEKGMKPFRPNAKQTLKRYYEVPADLIEDPDELTAWARRAIECQMEKRIPSGRSRRR
jgi:DNA transformation protein and related proteins